MIYEVEGDIMLSRAQVIAQGVATGDPMNRGLGRRLHERFPVMVEEFRQWCEAEQAQPGQLWMWGKPGQLQIVNMITHTGDDENLARVGRPDKIALNRCFRGLNSLYAEHRFKSIAMPMVGAGEFGLDWVEVRDMLHAQLSQLLIPVFVYVKELEGQIAHEPGL
jgi:O-acetyl-ADP-ribose deacetylase (regulator of RNase III)